MARTSPKSVRDLDPAETLFIVASKTFTTLETMTNAATRSRLAARGARAATRQAVARHFVAVSTNAAKVAEFGIDTANMFEFWDWVGGRYSMDSAIGLSTMLADRPGRLPRACSTASTRWTSTFAPRPFERNLPVLMGLLTVWYTNFFGAQTVAVLPYEQYLKRFPAYLQQLTMESNGKPVTLDGSRGDVPNRPGLLGRAGNQRPALVLSADPSGHAARSPATSSRSRSPQSPIGRHHDMLIANVFAQAEALAFGKTAEEVEAEGTPGLARAPPRVRGQPPVEYHPCRAA